MKVVDGDAGFGLLPEDEVLNSGVLSLSIGLGRFGYCGGGSISSDDCLEGDFLSLQ